MTETLIHTPDGEIKVLKPPKSAQQIKYGSIDSVELDNEEEILEPYRGLEVWAQDRGRNLSHFHNMVLRFYKRAKKNNHTVLYPPHFTRGGAYLRGKVRHENGVERRVAITSWGKVYVDK